MKPETRPEIDARPRLQCRCVWEGERCPKEATREDGLCDWCGTRRGEDLRDNPNAIWGPDGEYLGLGGAGEAHTAVGIHRDSHPDACWMPGSGRTLHTDLSTQWSGHGWVKGVVGNSEAESSREILGMKGDS